MDKKQTERERRRQIKKLLAAGTPEERKRIQREQKAGRLLRKQIERL